MRSNFQPITIEPSQPYLVEDFSPFKPILAHQRDPASRLPNPTKYLKIVADHEDDLAKHDAVINERNRLQEARARHLAIRTSLATDDDGVGRVGGEPQVDEELAHLEVQIARIKERIASINISNTADRLRAFILAHTAPIEPFDTPIEVTGTLDDIRAEIIALKRQLADSRAGPLDQASQEAAIRRHVAALIERGKPVVDFSGVPHPPTLPSINLLQYGVVKAPDGKGHPVAGRIVQDVIDHEAFEAWRNPDLTLKRYLSLVEVVKDGLTPEQRAERVDQLQSSILLPLRLPCVVLLGALDRISY
jgi:hypothetical protein